MRFPDVERFGFSREICNQNVHLSQNNTIGKSIMPGEQFLLKRLHRNSIDFLKKSCKQFRHRELKRETVTCARLAALQTRTLIWPPPIIWLQLFGDSDLYNIKKIGLSSTLQFCISEDQNDDLSCFIFFATNLFHP